MLNKDDLILDPSMVALVDQLTKKMKTNNICLFISGLAASGKTSIARMLSKVSGIPIVDSGLPFRLAAYLIHNIPKLNDDLRVFAKVMESHTIKIVNGEFRVISGEIDITERLRTNVIDELVPNVAADKRKRELVLKFLRQWTEPPAIIAARSATEPLSSGQMLQIELYAPLDIRAKRRASESGELLSTVKKSIKIRDSKDLIGPSRYPCSDVLNTTHLTLGGTLQRLIERAIWRIDIRNEHFSFRRHPIDNKIHNPFLESIAENIKQTVEQNESEQGVPIGQSKPGLLLNLSRYDLKTIFLDESIDILRWNNYDYPQYNLFEHKSNLGRLNYELLNNEVKSYISQKKKAILKFESETKILLNYIGDKDLILKSEKSEIYGSNAQGQRLVNYKIVDASPKLGFAIEDYLHYLGKARIDSTHRVVLKNIDKNMPVLYLSFSPNSRSYMEPLLWAMNLRMEETSIAVRGYGFPDCPQNAMSWFLRSACDKVRKDFPHLKAIATDINPNWGFTGSSFVEAGFIPVGIKFALPEFIENQYYTRRSLDNKEGRKAATIARMPLVPTIIYLRPFTPDVKRDILTGVGNGLLINPRKLYEKK